MAVLIQESNDGKRPMHSPKQYHVSLRSDGTVDVGEIASSFGGGGHTSAAGFTVKTTLAEIKAQIFALAEKLET